MADMNGETIALAGLGILGLLIGLLFLAWPGAGYASTDRFAVGLLFLIPGVIWLDMARRGR